MPSGRTVVTGGGVVAIAVAAILPYIQTFEGTKHVPYRDIVNVLTVCTGHTGPDVRPNTYYTDTKCSQLTDQDLTKAASGVLKITPNLATHPMPLASAISFSYNIGVTAYGQSDVARSFNAGNYKAACAEMKEYVHVKHVVIQGLVNRRQQEYLICMKGL